MNRGGSFGSDLFKPLKGWGQPNSRWGGGKYGNLCRVLRNLPERSKAANNGRQKWLSWSKKPRAFPLVGRIPREAVNSVKHCLEYRKNKVGSWAYYFGHRYTIGNFNKSDLCCFALESTVEPREEYTQEDNIWGIHFEKYFWISWAIGTCKQC